MTWPSCDRPGCHGKGLWAVEFDVLGQRGAFVGCKQHCLELAESLDGEADVVSIGGRRFE